VLIPAEVRQVARICVVSDAAYDAQTTWHSHITTARDGAFPVPVRDEVISLLPGRVTQLAEEIRVYWFLSVGDFVEFTRYPGADITAYLI